MLHLLMAIGLLLAVVVVREVVRALVQPEYRLRSIFALQTPGSHGRRALTITATLVATYLAVAAIAIANYQFYGVSDVKRYGVGDVLASGAAIGVLEKGDRIDAVDGQLLFVGKGTTLVEAVTAKQGAPVELSIVRGGAPRVVHVTPKPATDKQGRPVFQLGIRPVIVFEHSSEASVRRGLVHPFVTIKHLAKDVVVWLTGSEAVEITGVVRLAEGFGLAFEGTRAALAVASLYAVVLFVVFGVLDLLRFLVLIRDKVRA